MRLHALLVICLAGLSAANAIAAPEAEVGASTNELWKRRGGGGGGGRGGGSSGGGRSGGSSGSGRGSSSPPTRGQPGFAGSGAPRAYGGGSSYGGGGSTPYKAGSRTPVAGIAGIFAVGALLAFWPGVWLYGAHMYHYNNPYHFRNETTDRDEDLPVICACDPYNPCGCEENNSTEYVRSLIGSGRYDELNQSLVTVADVNGTKTLLINGTLPNGTEPPVPAEDGAGQGLRAMVEALGYWPMVAAIVSAVFVV
ncbi:uncharacterized protein DNG_04934 [Cephalotrichum gorgonifer]|uniref:DUF7732 domain-containing protein n=1 Tax=Cephalotrichum gorgonifer TaxID=2041049 RepID=A0AAE8MX30_9PEZI|nr:uncharacterized protein DNG_04934 [Cephalotrichum gorgonifer]